MAHQEWCLRPGEALYNNQYLRSKNGLFYAVMRDDGNFVVYRGDWWETHENMAMWNLFEEIPGWADKTREFASRYVAYVFGKGNFAISALDNPPGHFRIWSSGYYTEAGKGAQPDHTAHWAVMQDDGDFCIKRDGDGDLTWHTQTADSLDQKNSYFTEIVYDFKKQTIQPIGGPKRSSRSTAINKTDINQSSTLSLTYTESTASGWKTSSTLKVGLKIGFKLGVPITGEGSVEASSEFTRAWELNETTTKSEAKTINMPVVVPPGKGVIGQVTWIDSTITLPFMMKGVGTFSSGKTAPISLHGMYEGVATTDVTSTWIRYTETEETSARAMLMATPSR